MSIATKPEAVPSSLSDEEIVPRVLSGDVALFEVLMRRNNARLYRTLRGFLSDEAEIEDLMQQTYVLAYTRLGQFAEDARFSTWLIRIGINEALQKLRQQKKWHVVEGGDALLDGEQMRKAGPSSETTTPEDQADAREAVRLVERLVSRMPDIYRVVFMLREVERLSTADTAEALDVTEDTVKQRLFRARQLLKEELEARTGQSLSEIFPFHAPRCDRVVGAVMERIHALGLYRR